MPALRIALAASLLANVFAFGTVAGGAAMLARQNGWRARPAGPGRPIRSAGQDLPPDDRARFEALMRGMAAENRDLARTARDNREQAAALFVQPQFDRAAVAAALDRARQADFALRTRLEEAATGFAAGLPADARAALAAGLARRGPLRHPRP